MGIKKPLGRESLAIGGECCLHGCRTGLVQSGVEDDLCQTLPDHCRVHIGRPRFAVPLWPQLHNGSQAGLHRQGHRCADDGSQRGPIALPTGASVAPQDMPVGVDRVTAGAVGEILITKGDVLGGRVGEASVPTCCRGRVDAGMTNFPVEVQDCIADGCEVAIGTA